MAGPPTTARPGMSALETGLDIAYEVPVGRAGHLARGGAERGIRTPGRRAGRPSGRAGQRGGTAGRDAAGALGAESGGRGKHAGPFGIMTALFFPERAVVRA